MKSGFTPDGVNLAFADADMVTARMFVVRGQCTLLDRDVASLYKIDTRTLNQAVKRNAERFPDGYFFQLSDEEFRSWKSQIVTSNLPQAEKSAIKMGIRRFEDYPRSCQDKAEVSIVFVGENALEIVG